MCVCVCVCVWVDRYNSFQSIFIMPTVHCVQFSQLVEKQLMMKHREALTEEEDANETEELVGASSDQLEQDGSGVQQLEEEDETGDPSEETEVQQVCKPVIVCWVTCSSIVSYVHNIHTLTVLIIHVL